MFYTFQDFFGGLDHTPTAPLKFNPFHNLYGLFISGVLVALRGLDVYYSFFFGCSEGRQFDQDSIVFVFMKKHQTSIFTVCNMKSL